MAEWNPHFPILPVYGVNNLLSGVTDNIRSLLSMFRYLTSYSSDTSSDDSAYDCSNGGAN